MSQFTTFKLSQRALIPRIAHSSYMLTMSMIMNFHALKKSMELDLWQKLWMHCNTFLLKCVSITYLFIKLHILISLIHTLHLKKTNKQELTENPTSFHLGPKTWTGIVIYHLNREETYRWSLKNPRKCVMQIFSKWKYRVIETLLMYKNMWMLKW